MSRTILMKALSVALLVAWSAQISFAGEGTEPVEKGDKPTAAKAEGEKGRREKQEGRKGRAEMSPEKLAELKEKAKANIDRQTANLARMVERTQARCDELNAQANQDTVTLYPPAPEALAAFRRGKGRMGANRMRTGRDRARKAKEGEAAVEPKPDPLALQVPNNDILKAAFTAAAEAHSQLLTAQTTQKEELGKAVGQFESAEGKEAMQVLRNYQRGGSPETMKALADAESAVQKAEGQLMMLSTKTWLAGIDARLQTEAGKTGANGARDAYDAYLKLKEERAQLETKMAEQATAFQAALTAVLTELTPAKPDKADGKAREEKRKEREKARQDKPKKEKGEGKEKVKKEKAEEKKDAEPKEL